VTADSFLLIFCINLAVLGVGISCNSPGRPEMFLLDVLSVGRFVLVGLENLEVDVFCWSPGCLAECIKLSMDCFIESQVGSIKMLPFLLDFFDVFDRDRLGLLLEYLDAAGR
jgi:hypothetical protein